MFLDPNRFAFIHIPRTGGVSIASALAGSGEIADGMMFLNPVDIGFRLHRHTKARQLKARIKNWDSLFRWSVIRNPFAIVESTYRLARSQPVGVPVVTSPQWWAYVGRVRRLTFEQFVLQEMRWLDRSGGHIGNWCLGDGGEDLGVEIFRYEDLDEHWPAICRRCGISEQPRRRLNGAAGDPIEWTDAARQAIATWCARDLEWYPELRL